LPTSSLLLNLGAARLGSTTRYDVAAGVLRSTDASNGDTPTPIASNIVNVKLQYGIDSDDDGALDAWVAATAAWSPASILAAPWSTLSRIKAIRIGVIARAELADRMRARDFHWVLFDCERDDKSACPGRLEGTIAATPSGSYRYSVVETVVPLRNVLWRRSG
jgi:type IV pilus assembly protein PilW